MRKRNQKMDSRLLRNAHFCIHAFTKMTSISIQHQRNKINLNLFYGCILYDTFKNSF